MSDGMPYCSVQYPKCGSCWGDLAHDGDSFYCDPCGLDYGDGEDGTIATFRDDEATPCDAPCTNSWHHDGAMPEWVYSCHPCALPTGHTSPHWADCDVTKAVAARGEDGA